MTMKIWYNDFTFGLDLWSRNLAKYCANVVAEQSKEL